MNSPVRVLLIGSAGRMGQTIVQLANRESGVQIVAQCDQGDSITSAMPNCDVAIDFSAADAVEEICRETRSYKKALIIGTTGHSAAQKDVIRETAKSIAIVFASNFSVGVNALFWLTRKAAETLGSDFESRIVETHHVMKKDAPSGTAKTLGEILQDVQKVEVPIESIREGEVVGEHTVIFS